MISSEQGIYQSWAAGTRCSPYGGKSADKSSGLMFFFPSELLCLILPAYQPPADVLKQLTPFEPTKACAWLAVKQNGKTSTHGLSTCGLVCSRLKNDNSMLRITWMTRETPRYIVTLRHNVVLWGSGLKRAEKEIHISNRSQAGRGGGQDK